MATAFWTEVREPMNTALDWMPISVPCISAHTAFAVSTAFSVTEEDTWLMRAAPISV